MSAESDQITIEQRLVVPRIVVSSMLASLAVFAVVVWVTAKPIEPQPGDDLLMIVAGLVLLAGTAVSLVFGRFQSERYRKRGVADDDEVARAFFQSTAVRAAALEAPGFLCLVAFMISGRVMVLVGAGIAALLMAALLPTRESYEAFRDRLTEPR